MIWKDETLKLRPPIAGEPLRVGVWLESTSILPWIAQTIRSLRQTSGIELAVVFHRDGPAITDSRPAKPLAYRLYEHWNLRAGGDDNPFREIPMGDALHGVPSEPLPDAAHQFADWNLDVLICLLERRPSGACGGWARYGVWSLGLSSPELEPAYFWEMYRNDAVSELMLYVHTRDLSEGRIAYRYSSATRRGWRFETNAVEPLSMAPVIVIRRLLDVERRGWDALSELPTWREGDHHLTQNEQYPGAIQLAVFFARRLFERLRISIHSRRGEPKWFICLRRSPEAFTKHREQFDGRGFLPVPNPAGSTLADPFPWHQDGRTYLFVEEIVNATNRGHLSVCEVLPEGLSPLTEVFRRPFHVSYPCLTEWNGATYMIPETAENRTVELHRADRFPHHWHLEKTLQRDVLLVDTTPFFHQGLWYFFTATVEEVSGNWLETWLFYSDRLDGDWTYHPSNPICSDVRRARPAGHLFYRNGKLIRPAQDCSIRYGYALVLNEVLELSPARYEERPVEVILPDWMEGIFATHTLNATGDLEAIDATRIPTA